MILTLFLAFFRVQNETAKTEATEGEAANQKPVWEDKHRNSSAFLKEMLSHRFHPKAESAGM